ncbi:MAG: hypothetical protein Faunusvirus10_6 [Faunusvirus sp.]|uniref:Uncharacterized protein n=1 Tax=Faunusvirus sp. TaxID=2487766 RepID=A0A3G5A0I0_9VIRU|nr:MAG: hypothetical protein Faunusvirus10_6 [Faunusvirus sp.]
MITSINNNMNIFDEYENKLVATWQTTDLQQYKYRIKWRIITDNNLVPYFVAVKIYRKRDERPFNPYAVAYIKKCIEYMNKIYKTILMRCMINPNGMTQQIDVPNIAPYLSEQGQTKSDMISIYGKYISKQKIKSELYNVLAGNNGAYVNEHYIDILADSIYVDYVNKANSMIKYKFKNLKQKQYMLEPIYSYSEYNVPKPNVNAKESSYIPDATLSYSLGMNNIFSTFNKNDLTMKFKAPAAYSNAINWGKLNESNLANLHLGEMDDVDDDIYTKTKKYNIMKKINSKKNISKMKHNAYLVKMNQSHIDYMKHCDAIFHDEEIYDS